MSNQGDCNNNLPAGDDNPSDQMVTVKASSSTLLPTGSDERPESGCADSELPLDELEDSCTCAASTSNCSRCSRFSANSQTTAGNNGSGDKRESDCYLQDIHFEPAGDLPSLVPLRTGEEEEILLFKNRAKLYRFDTTGKEWKERGIGNMKILFHPVKNTFRLVLRREQVHKVVCNHLITPDLVLNPLRNYDCAWVWATVNHAEGKPEAEKLAVKFKNKEVAHEFKVKFDECKEKFQSKEDSIIDDELQKEVLSSTRSLSDLSISNLVEGSAHHSRSSSAMHGSQVFPEPSVTSTMGEVPMRLEDEVDDDDEEEDEEETGGIFIKRASVYLKDLDGDCAELGAGDLYIRFSDRRPNPRAVLVDATTEEILCNVMLSVESVVKLNRNECEFDGVDYCSDDQERKIFVAKFNSEKAARDFKNVVDATSQSDVNVFVHKMA